MKINNLLLDFGDDVYYQKEFYSNLEANSEYILSKYKSILYPTGEDTIIYNGDLFGYLLNNKISPKYHYITMFINNIKSPFDFNSNVIKLYIPDGGVVNNLLQLQIQSPGGVGL